MLTSSISGGRHSAGNATAPPFTLPEGRGGEHAATNALGQDHKTSPPTFAVLPSYLNPTPLALASQPADNTLLWLNAAPELPCMTIREGSIGTEIGTGGPGSQAHASTSTPSQEQSMLSDASPGSRATAASNVTSGSTAGKSSSSRNRDLRQLLNPLGLLVFASLDVPKPNPSIEGGVPSQYGLSARSQQSGDVLAAPLTGVPEDEDVLVATSQDIYFRTAGAGRPGSMTADRRLQQPAAYHILSKEQ